MTSQPQQWPPDGERSLVESVSYRLSSFIRSFTTLLYVGMAMAVAGLVMKFFAITGGSFVFVFSMAVLMLLFLVQVGLSFFYIISSVRLALLGSVSSLALVLGFLALIFRYQVWYGWQVVLFIALPLYLLTGVLLILYLRDFSKLHEPLRNFLYRNLLIPFSFVLILGIVAFLVNPEAYNQEEADMLQESPLENRTEAADDTSGMWRAY
jgi:MFS family permease